MVPEAAEDMANDQLVVRGKELPRGVEGASEARWIVMDYLDVVVHVFLGEVREHYRLEAVWGDVPRLEVDPERLAALVPQGA